MQNEITQGGPLLDENGNLTQIGWSRQPLLDCNLEKVNFYSALKKPFQRFRVKRWDYYAVFTPKRFFSATIADLGYAGNIFVYTLDFESNQLYEEGLIIPLGKGIQMPRNSTEGDTIFDSKKAQILFQVQMGKRTVCVEWDSYNNGKGIHADLNFYCPQEHESMTIVIPIEEKRFYYNRKINCMPVDGTIQYGDRTEELEPTTSIGSLDWGRGVWAYSSFWNWASASGFLPDGRTIGLNLGCGFGDTSAASEDCMILDGRVHKFGAVQYDYDHQDYHKPWRFTDQEGRCSLEFTPFQERLAQTDLKIITSEVHQMFGRYSGTVITDEGETIVIKDLIGFAEEHQARW
jgi:hypothetical protein